MDYLAIFTRLNKEKIDYLVAGGVAVNFHGIPRMTYDLDLMLMLQPENITKMVSFLLELKYRPRAPVDPFDLAKEKIREVWIKEKRMKAFNFYSEIHPIAEIDLVIDSNIAYDQLKQRSVSFNLEDVKVPVISIPDLIALKLHAGRQQDLSDVEHLNTILEM